jgi:hypothetical protein
MSEVARPGDQIVRAIDPAVLTLPPSAGAQPTFRIKGTDYWAQGVDLGLEFRY